METETPEPCEPLSFIYMQYLTLLHPLQVDIILAQMFGTPVDVPCEEILYYYQKYCIEIPEC